MIIRFSRFLLFGMVLFVILTGIGRCSTSGTVIRSGDVGGIFQVRVNRGLLVKIKPGSLVTPGGAALEPSSVMPGDRIDFSTAPGRPRVTVRGRYLAGELLVMKKDKLLTARGRQVYFSADCLFLVNGKPASSDGFARGMRVFLRVDPETGLTGTVYGVDTKKKPENLESAPSITLIRGPVKKKAYRRGSSIAITVGGTPDCLCTVDVPGVFGGLPAREVTPGIYKADYTFTRADARGTRMIIHLAKNGRTTTRLDPAYFDVAASPPVVEAVSPEPGKKADPGSAIIFARISSPGTLVNPRATTVYLDGRPLSAGVQKNVDYVVARVPAKIRGGVHRVRVVSVDRAGNSGSASWSFIVP